MLYIHAMEHYAVFKKKEILLFCKIYKPEDVMLSETDQLQKGKYCMIILI